MGPRAEWTKGSAVFNNTQSNRGHEAAKNSGKIDASPCRSSEEQLWIQQEFNIRLLGNPKLKSFIPWRECRSREALASTIEGEEFQGRARVHVEGIAGRPHSISAT
jgi:hypothetical protein